MQTIVFASYITVESRVSAVIFINATANPCSPDSHDEDEEEEYAKRIYQGKNVHNKFIKYKK